MTWIWEAKTGTDDLLIDYDSVDPKMLEMQAALYRQIMLDTLIGRADDGMDEYWASVGTALKTFHGKGDNNTSIFFDEKPKLPQKICNYRNPRVYWYGEAGNNIPYSIGTGATHWTVQGQRLHSKLEEYFAEYSNESLEISNSYEDDWVETRTLNKSSRTWKPQGEIIVMSGQPPKINDKEKDTLEQVKAISYPPAE